MKIINKYEGFIFDLDGTIYLDDSIIPGAEKVVNKIKSLNKKSVFISNKTTGNIDDYYNLLTQNKFNIQKKQIITSTFSTKKYLSKHYFKKKFFAIAEKKFIMEIEAAGLEFCENPNQIDIILISLDRTLNYSKLEIAAKALDNGAKFFAANIDNTCPVVSGEILDAGSTISALERRTGLKLQKHFGKPSKYMFNEVMKNLNLSIDKCLILGDRLETDIAMGNKFGIDTALVLSGVSKNTNIKSKYKPTYILSSVIELLEI